MKPLKVPYSELSAITDEKGDFLLDPDSTDTAEVMQIYSGLNVFTPANIFENSQPAYQPEQRKRGLLESLGMSTIKLIGVDALPLWLPIIILLASIGCFFIFGRMM